MALDSLEESPRVGGEDCVEKGVPRDSSLFIFLPDQRSEVGDCLFVVNLGLKNKEGVSIRGRQKRPEFGGSGPCEGLGGPDGGGWLVGGFDQLA